MDKNNRLVLDSLYILLTVLAGTIIEWPIIVVSLLSYVFGILVSSLIFKGLNDAVVYRKLFIIGYLYFLICAFFMLFHDFSWLLSPDTGTFVDRIQSMVIEGEGNYMNILSSIYSDFNVFTSEEHFFYAYSSLWGILIWSLGGNFYLCLQLSVLLIYALAGVVIYEILTINHIPRSKGQNYTIIICTISIFLFYSTQVLRDIHIMFMYLCTFYIILKSKNFSIKHLLFLIIIIFITMGLRIESGLFLFTSIPLYILSLLNKTRQKLILTAISVPLLVVLFFLYSKYSYSVEEVYEFNREHYVDNVAEGAGVIGSLQKIPVLGDILSIFYNALLPIPCWSRLSPFGGKYGLEAYNILNFPKTTASFLNLLTIIFILSWLLNNKVNVQMRGKVSNSMKYLLICGFVFLYLQSAVIDFRRLMGYYSLFYILFFMIWNNIKRETRKQLVQTTVFIYVFIQLFGLIYIG